MKVGRYEIFNERPIKSELILYCANDVELLPGLFEIYRAKLYSPGKTFWRYMVSKATADRIKDSWSKCYDGHASSKVCGPWDSWLVDDGRETWNDDVLMAVKCGEDLDMNDCWVPLPAIKNKGVPDISTLMAQVK